MNKNWDRTKKVGKLLVLGSIIAAFLTGCGGGGSSGSVGDTTPPTVSSVSPANNAPGVALNSTISATFNEAMTASTLGATTFTLNNGATCAVTYSGATATCTPSANLTTGTQYTATITSGAKDAAGNALAAPYTWTFTTATATSISGTAAAGAPVVGYVSVQDSSNKPQPVLNNIAIAADGKYSIDVTGLTPPFAIKADGTVGGRRVTLYSPATSADAGGTINITPFTDLIVRNLAGTLANTLIDSYLSSGSLANLTATQINAERDKLQAQLLPVLQAAGLSTSIDLLRASFNADGTGLDRFMDLVKVDTTIPTAVTITNILDANAADKLTINSQTGVTTGASTLAVGAITSTATTPIDLIRQTLTSFIGYFATSLPSSTDLGLNALFAPTYMWDGENSSAWLTQLTTNSKLIGMKFGTNGLVLDSIDLANGIAQVSFIPVTASGVRMGTGTQQMQMKKVGNAWLMDGNQRLANIQVTSIASQTLCVAGSTTCTPLSTGLDLWFENYGQQPIGNVIVTGPGLPTAGVTITGNKYVFMTDAQIGALSSNGVYTMAVWSNAATPVLMATYTSVVAAVPVLNTALANVAFPTLSGLTNLTNYAGGNLYPVWTMPAGLHGDNVGVSVWDVNNVYLSNSYNLSGSGTGTANLVLPAPATGKWAFGNYWIRGWDVNGSEFITNYQ